MLIDSQHSKILKRIKMKTFTLSAKNIEKKWHLIDATDLVVGRLASHLANILRGKHKPEFSPNLDCGDHVVIINAEKIKFTGNKLKDKIYYWHTGHPGGIKQRTMGQILEGKFPDRVLRKAVQRMIPKGPLGRQQLKHLHIYTGSEHPHAAQQPAPMDFGAMNRKNKKA